MLFLMHRWGSPEGDEAEILGLLIYPVEAPDPVEYIKFIIDQRGLKYKDLIPIFGTLSRVSEVLNKKRRFTLKMIKNLHTQLQIPYSIFFQQIE